jgi:hypothetical protein
MLRLCLVLLQFASCVLDLSPFTKVEFIAYFETSSHSGDFLSHYACVSKILSLSALRCGNYCLVLLGGTGNEDWFSRGPKRIISRHLAPNAYQLCTASLSSEVPVPQPGRTDCKGNQSHHSVTSWHCGRSSHTRGWPDNQLNAGKQNTKRNYLGL